ncbi:membrane protein [Sphingobacterium cellulitidis]|uniref:Membrane protein n=2 Tax=Sphingobacterium cellulitidis TaxID=1768011 RepID=A0A8H9G042_9SPHI|nr:membrane protein [Sphingobacterium soli]
MIMKKTNKILIVYFIVLAYTLLVSSCADEFLDKRKDKSQIVPETLDDVQLLLDNNVQNFGSTPGLPTIAADEFFTDQAVLSNLEIYERNSYTWAKDFYEGTIFNLDWTNPFQQIFYANTVLDILSEIKESSKESSTRGLNLQGAALFHRSYAFYNLAQLFAENYLPSFNDQAPGIPLKLTGNIHEPLTRASLKDTYARIISDLKLADNLLPSEVENLTRPSKVSAKALLARIYLSISDYHNALKYAQQAMPTLSLLDYSEIDTTNTIKNLFPAALPKENPEIAFYSVSTGYYFPVYNSRVMVDSLFYEDYEKGDLRKIIFFRKLANSKYVVFRGSYSSIHTSEYFSGLALDELLLIQAECLARTGKGKQAIQVLNSLRRARFSKGEYEDLQWQSDQETLSLVLQERRKELFARGLRLGDLKRLNREDQFKKTLIRNLDGKELVLEPDDPRYIFPIPSDEIQRHGFVQNNR